MPNKIKKWGKKSKRSREERMQNVDFCACPNFESCDLPSGTKASLVLDF